LSARQNLAFPDNGLGHRADRRAFHKLFVGVEGEKELADLAGQRLIAAAGVVNELLTLGRRALQRLLEDIFKFFPIFVFQEFMWKLFRGEARLSPHSNRV
jgi:hypothetical protein